MSPRRDGVARCEELSCGTSTMSVGEHVRRIYFEPSGRLHSTHQTLLDHPPEGFEFLTPQTAWDTALEPVLRSDLVFFTLQRRVLRHLLPLSFVKAWLEAFTRKPPKLTPLTYAFGHVIFRKEPWVLEAEWITHLVGYNLFYFRLLRGWIEHILSSESCKRVICWSDFAKQHYLHTVKSATVRAKLTVVFRAGAARNFTKAPREDSKVKLLFVGSANMPGEFEEKGGKEVVEAFTVLQQRYPNVELVVRSDLPDYLKRRYKGITNLKLIDSIISREELEQEFAAADIFVMAPWHTPPTVYLDAMSYELPIVTTDLFGTGELVEDGVTGLLVAPSPKVAGYFRNWIPNWNSPAYRSALRSTDSEVVRGLVEKLGIAIENAELGRQMGKAGRWEVEHGKFSIAKRNEKLKRIFDEAIAEGVG